MISVCSFDLQSLRDSLPAEPQSSRGHLVSNETVKKRTSELPKKCRVRPQPKTPVRRCRDLPARPPSSQPCSLNFRPVLKRQRKNVEKEDVSSSIVQQQPLFNIFTTKTGMVSERQDGPSASSKSHEESLVETRKKVEAQSECSAPMKSKSSDFDSFECTMPLQPSDSNEDVVDLLNRLSL